MAVFKYKNVKNVTARTEISVEGHLRPLVDFFVSGGGGEGAAPVTRDKLRHIFTSYPPILVYDIDTRVKPVVDFLRELGSEDPIRCVPRVDKVSDNEVSPWPGGARAGVERKNAAAALTNVRSLAPRALHDLCARVNGRMAIASASVIADRPSLLGLDATTALPQIVSYLRRNDYTGTSGSRRAMARPGPRPADARVRPNPTRAG